MNLQDFELDQIVCMDSNNLEKMLPANLVNLSIVFPPRSNSKDHYSEFNSILEKINLVTKLGGICCFLVEDEIDPKLDVMSMNATKSILEILDSKNNWFLDDKIIWIKSTKENVQQTNSLDSITAVSFEDTPFTTIYILVKKGSKFEPVDFREKAQSLLVSQVQKDEIMEDFWYIHPVSENGFTDRIPKELASRLIMLFSNENELILDPFCGNGIIGVVANFLNRMFLCLDENNSNCEIAKKRIQQ